LLTPNYISGDYKKFVGELALIPPPFHLLMMGFTSEEVSISLGTIGFKSKGL
jgi:hypothetical protein